MIETVDHGHFDDAVKHRIGLYDVIRLCDDEVLSPDGEGADSMVAAVTISRVAVNPVPLDCSSDEALVGELDMQMRVLAAKVIA